MTVQLVNGTIRLEQSCPVGDAEILLNYLLAEPAADVDWRSCSGAHLAVIQVLLWFRRKPDGQPLSDILAKIVWPP